MNFENKNLLIVGGTSGIGLELARMLQSSGGKIYNISRKSASDLDQMDVEHLSADITADEDLEKIQDFLPDTLHGLAYCPGTINLKPFHSLTKKDFQADWNVNVLGAVTAIQAALQPLKQSRGASILLFSTVAAQVGMNFHASVAAAKAALHGLALSLAAEYAGVGLRANVIAPSITKTPLAAGLLGDDKKIEMSAARHPLKRIGDAREIASLGAFLLSDNAGWITGQIVGVDGGMAGARPLR